MGGCGPADAVAASAGTGGGVVTGAGGEGRSRRLLRVLEWSASFAGAFFLFVLAIQLMKGGARELAPVLQDSRLFSNGVTTLGAGWLGAYLVLSGSPVAAVALGLFSGAALTELQTFTMLSGSRLGASFIVLLVGFLYAIRNPDSDRRESVGMGVLALSLTALVYLPGMVIGYALLKQGILAGIAWHASGELLSVIEVIWGPALAWIRGVVPAGLELPLGLAVILVSFNLLDRALPTVDAAHATRRPGWLERPWTMFALGCLVATLTLSVSVALTLLVPLASHGYLRREQSIPYIMGANITTLADTLVAAMLTGNVIAVQIVLAEAIGVSVVSLLLLAVGYPSLRRAVIALDDWVVATHGHLWLFVGILFFLPAVLLTSGIWLGPFTD